jgi:hypothetical protein
MGCRVGWFSPKLSFNPVRYYRGSMNWRLVKNKHRFFRGVFSYKYIVISILRYGVTVIFSFLIR